MLQIMCAGKTQITVMRCDAWKLAVVVDCLGWHKRRGESPVIGLVKAKTKEKLKAADQDYR